MDLNLSHDPTKLIAVGKSGFGKTLFTNEWLLRSKYDCYFIFDHDGQFAQRHRLKAAYRKADLLGQLRRGFVIYNPAEEWVSLKGEVTPIFRKQIVGGKLVKVFRGYAGAFAWFCEYAYKMSERLQGTKLLYCDEIQDIVDTNFCPEYVGRVMLSGRNRSLDFLGASLQYNFVHNEIRGQATTTVAFCTEEDLALEKLVGRGFKAKEVAALPRFHYIRRDHITGRETRGVVSPPRR